MLRRPSIATVVRPKAGPIFKRGLPVATSSRSRLSSSGVHRLLLFFGMGAVHRTGLTTNIQVHRGLIVPISPQFFPTIDERNGMQRYTFS